MHVPFWKFSHVTGSMDVRCDRALMYVSYTPAKLSDPDRGVLRILYRGVSSQPVLE